MSLAHFRRQFREVTGHAPHQYLRRIHINRTKLLLRGTDKTTEIIAEKPDSATTPIFQKHSAKRKGLLRVNFAGRIRRNFKKVRQRQS